MVTTDVNHANIGFTALIGACLSGHTDVVVTLIDKGKADVNHSNKFYKTALHFAVERNQLAVVNTLIAKGANVNCTLAKEAGGISPLYMAVQNGNVKAVSVLLKAGAQMGDLLDTNGVSAITVAAFLGHNDVVSLLRSRQDVDVDKYLIDEKANQFMNREVKDSSGKLMRCSNGHAMIFRLFGVDDGYPNGWFCKPPCHAFGASSVPGVGCIECKEGFCVRCAMGRGALCAIKANKVPTCDADNCSNAAPSLCAGCLTARFCSLECQAGLECAQSRVQAHST